MTEVIHTQNNNKTFVESTFNSLLSRYFSCECKEDREGNLVCTIGRRNINRPSDPKIGTLYIHRDNLDNYGYVRALIDKSLRDIVR